MAAFQYAARKAAGDLVNGMMEAASPREVLEKLAEESLFAVRIDQAKQPTTAILSRGRVGARHVSSLFGQLSDLLHSGVPLLRSLEILQRQSTKPALAAVLTQLRSDVADGASLADAMGRHPTVFSELATSMVRAGQEGGFLEEVLQRVADFADHQQELKSRVIGALAYPLFLLATTCVVLVVMLTFFVPRFEPIFQRMRQANQLPGLTEWLLATSSFIQHHYLLVTMGAVAIAGFGWTLLRSEQGRLAIDRFKLWAPGLRPICRGLAIARFSRILGTLLANGIPILNALRIAKDSAGNRILARAIDQAADSVSGGEPLAGPLKASGQFPGDILEMIAVGEESNSLDRVLVNVANTLERRITRQMDVLVRLLEPVLLLIMAGVTLVVVAALLLPVISSSSVM